ncbi:ArsR family transcriptional regulator [Candidatus Woesearchaeota archaeon]|nr:ArsR family transcriptional regulator [Candidatus Woesearchaeota archaeon]
MAIRHRKIVIINSSKPSDDNINQELQWFCNSLGLFGTRDKDKSCFRLFIILLKSLKSGDELTSDQIAARVGLSRGTVVHHLHKLIGSGLVVSRQNTYSLKVDNLKELVDEVERDINRTMRKLKDVAEGLDDRLDL